MEKKLSYIQILPLLFGFFVMGFVDIVGIASNYVKEDFGLSGTLAALLPMMVFLWFAVFSIPSGLIMGKIGKKNTVLLSIGITIFSMLIPIVSYSFNSALLAFALLGIGNTILQVSLNPMIAQTVSTNKIASILTVGQFSKAISSFLGPVLVGFTSFYWSDWKLVFAIYAVFSLLSFIWLLLSVRNFNERKTEQPTLHSVFVLFKDKNIILLFIAILAIVGIDVGLNMIIPGLYMSKTDISLNEAGLGTSLYFISRTIGTFGGAFLLAYLNKNKIFIVGMIIALISLSSVFFVNNIWLLSIIVVLVGLSCSNVFSILFANALNISPKKENEVSSLMIMGISGGALVMPFIGFLSDEFGCLAGLIPLMLCMFYLLAVSVVFSRDRH